MVPKGGCRLVEKNTCMYNRSGFANRSNSMKEKEVMQGKRHKQLSAYKMELQASHSLCTEVPPTGNLGKNKGRNRADAQAVM